MNILLSFSRRLWGKGVGLSEASGVEGLERWFWRVRVEGFGLGLGFRVRKHVQN